MKQHIQTIVNAALYEEIKNGLVKVIATSVVGRLRIKTGSTYNCFNLEVKLDNGDIRMLAKGFEAYGYGRSYEERAEKVLKSLGLNDRCDFAHKEYVKAIDMFKVKHYEDDIKCKWFYIFDENTLELSVYEGK